MDYTTVPRSLIYRERRSMEEFGAYDADSITRPLAEAMLRMDFIQESDSENRALWCMNTAFYICTMVLMEVDPRWRLSKYKNIAIPKWNYKPEEFRILTLSLAGLLLSRLEESLPLLSMKGQTRNHFVSLMLDEGEFNSIFKQLYDRLKDDPHITGTIPNSTFSPRVIDKECVQDVMTDTAFNWITFTNFMEERSMRDIVKAFGTTEEEKHNVVDILRQAANGFYTAGYNDRPEEVNTLLDIIDEEIYLQYNPEAEKALLDAKNEELKYLGDTRPLQAKIEEQEKEILNLKEQLSAREKLQEGNDSDEEDEEVEMLTELKSVPVLKFLWYLMQLDGANVEGHGKKKPAQNIMSTISKIPFNTTKKFWEKEEEDITRQEDLLIKMNHWMKTIGMKFQF